MNMRESTVIHLFYANMFLYIRLYLTRVFILHFTVLHSKNQHQELSVLGKHSTTEPYTPSALDFYNVYATFML